MAYVASGSLVRQLGSLFESGSVAGWSDRQLIDRFLARRDTAGEAAFAALVARHGPMVLDVCRQLLGDRHHAEDAFQAVFLVLARKAGSIRDPDLLGNWLYGVSLRTARKAKVRLARRRASERCDAMTGSELGSTVPADQAAIDREQAEALHDEIARLPRTFRLPVVLCYLEGLTVHEAARQLRWSHGTVRSRMARARDKLRRGLTAPRRRLARRRSGRGFEFEARRGVRLIPPMRHHDPGCDELRGWTGRRARRVGHGPGGAEIHALSQAEAHRVDRVVPRRRRQRRGLRQSGTGSSGGKTGSTSNRREAGRCEFQARSRPDVRTRPGARSVGQTGAERDGDGLRMDHAIRDSRAVSNPGCRR